MAFSFYKKCEIQPAQVPSSQSNFRSLMPFLGGDADILAAARSDGHDIRPYSDAALTLPLAFELVWYDAATGAFEMWVEITAATATDVYMAYGDATVSADGSTVWPAKYKLVHHFGGKGVLSLHDSSAAANVASNVGGNPVTAGTGKIGGAGTFDGVATAIDTGLACAIPNSVDFTFSAWFKSSAATDQMFQLAALDAPDFQAAGLGVASDGTIFGSSADNAHNGDTLGCDAPATEDGSWHWALYKSVYGGNSSLFVDGVPATNGSALNTRAAAITASHIFYGRNAGNAGALQLNGLLDECHFIVGPAPSDDWILAEYRNQFAPATFWSTGAQTVPGGGSDPGGGSGITHKQSFIAGPGFGPYVRSSKRRIHLREVIENYA